MAHVGKVPARGGHLVGTPQVRAPLLLGSKGTVFMSLGVLITLSVSSSSLIRHSLKSLKAGAAALFIPQVCHQQALSE